MLCRRKHRYRWAALSRHELQLHVLGQGLLHPRQVSLQQVHHIERAGIGPLGHGQVNRPLAVHHRVPGPHVPAILDLVHVANAISARRDFSIRAVRRGEEEIGILVDTFNHMITQIELRDQQLKDQVQRAEAARIAKSQFLATMSHEIRTPINGVLGMTQLLLDTNLTPEQRSYLETVRGSADALLMIINDILDFSRIEARKLEIDQVAFELPALIEDVRRLFALRASRKKLRFECRVAPNVPPAVKADPGRLRQILVNLLDFGLDLQAAGGVSVASHAPLRLGPAHHRGRPGRPALRRRPAGAGVGLVPQVQQADVPERLRAEPADFQVVLQDRPGLAHLVRPGREELPLEGEARSPGEHAAHVQPLAFDLEKHVLRPDALGRGGVVGAAGGVDVVVAAEKAVGGRIDPTFQIDRDLRCLRLRGGLRVASAACKPKGNGDNAQNISTCC